MRPRLRPQRQELHSAPQLRLLLRRQVLRGRGAGPPVFLERQRSSLPARRKMGRGEPIFPSDEDKMVLWIHREAERGDLWGERSRTGHGRTEAPDLDMRLGLTLPASSLALCVPFSLLRAFL